MASHYARLDFSRQAGTRDAAELRRRLDIGGQAGERDAAARRARHHGGDQADKRDAAELHARRDGGGQAGARDAGSEGNPNRQQLLPEGFPLPVQREPPLPTFAQLGHILCRLQCLFLAAGCFVEPPHLGKSGAQGGLEKETL